MTDICGVVNCVRCFTRSLAHNTCVPSERSSSDHMSTVRARPHDMSHSRNASFLPTAAATYHISLSNFPTSYTPRRTANPPLSPTHYTFNGRRYKSAPRGLLPWSSQSQVHRARTRETPLRSLYQFNIAFFTLLFSASVGPLLVLHIPSFARLS